MPVANEGGKLFYTQTGGAHSTLFRASAVNGSNPRKFLSNSFFDNFDVKRPTAAFGYVHFLVAQPGQGFCHEFAYEDSGDIAGSTKCDLTDVAANPGIQETIAYVRDGSVFLNDISGFREVEVAHSVGATRVEWGYDGTVLLFDETNGATTTLEALWMGVPVVALNGARHSGRVGASLLTHAGVPELLAQTTEDYLAAAVALARDATRRRGYRQGLREALLRSPLLDGDDFARRMETAYRQAWRDWCG